MATLIRANGTTETVEPNPGPEFSLSQLYRLLECSMIEVIPFPPGRVMVIDEEGKLNSKPYNPLATKRVSEQLKTQGRSLLPGDIIVGHALIASQTEMGS